MNKSNLDLFKQALSEGLSSKIESVVRECQGEIRCSKKHAIAMRTIIRGKIPHNRTATPKMRWIIAAILVAALLLTGCAIRFREKIIGFIEEIIRFDVRLTPEDKDAFKDRIDERYELSYVPDGYVFNDSQFSPSVYMQTFVNSDGTLLIFDQIAAGSGSIYFTYDGNDKILLNVSGYEVYHRIVETAGVMYYYVWNVDGYTFKISSYEEISLDDLALMVSGVRLEQ